MSGTVSELILKKGPLSPVWIAGTMKDKVGKKLVLATDIASVAKQIMEEEGVGLVLRLSGMLLKGLVVVYSKKTQYMLIDCEEVITKIMQSFKPGAVNLPVAGRRAADDALTVQIERDGRPVAAAIPDLDAWMSDPEARFVVAAEPLEFATPENSQVLEPMSEGSMSSVQSSQVAVSSDLGEEFVPPPRADAPAWEPVPEMPEWVDLPESDVVPMPESDSDQEQEREGEEGGKEKREKIVDQRVELGDGRQGQRRRRARAAATVRQQTLPQNEELEELFEIARREFGRPPPAAATESEDGGFDAVPYDDDIEIQRNREPDAPPEIDGTSDDGFPPGRESSASASDVELEPMRRPSAMESFREPDASLQSPYPNYQFSIERAHRRSVQDSITNETIDTINTVRKAMGEKESVTFAQVFAGASKHVTAKAFYQLMVLRSTAMVDIKQTKPFGPIEITRGPKYLRGAELMA